MMSNRAYPVCRTGTRSINVQSMQLYRAYLRNFQTTRIVLNESNEDLMKKIKDELKNSMRSKDNFASTVYRSILSEYQYAEKSGSKAVSMINIVQKALSKRQDSAKQFRSASREDLAEKEDRESDLIRSFLPEQISKEELEKIVSAAVEEAKKSGIDGKKLMGEVMKRVSGQVDKARAPGGLISEAVKKLLS